MISRIRESTSGAADRLRSSHAARLYDRSREINLLTHVLALGAQQVLCTAPLVVAVSALVQRASGRGMGTLLSRLFGLDGPAAADVARLFSGSSRVSLGELVLGVVLALLLGTGVAATQQRGFELLWGLPRVDGLRAQLRQLLWGIALAAYITAMVVAGRFGRWIGHVIVLDSWTAALLQGAVTAAFYWWGQRLLLSGRVRYRDLLPGALCVGVGILALTKITPLVLSSQINQQVRDYGLIGAVFVLSFWLMALSAVLMGGVMAGVLIVRRGAAMKPVVGARPSRGRHLGLTEPAVGEEPAAQPATPEGTPDTSAPRADPLAAVEPVA